MTDEDKLLVERLASSAKAFRKHPIYDSEGDPVLLTVQADELAQGADRITALSAEVERLTEILAAMDTRVRMDIRLGKLPHYWGGPILEQSRAALTDKGN